MLLVSRHDPKNLHYAHFSNIDDKNVPSDHEGKADFKNIPSSHYPALNILLFGERPNKVVYSLKIGKAEP
jgi:hypothetical protein